MSGTFKTVVIGTSLNAGSDAVVRTGVALARATGASPWLVHGFTLPTFAPDAGAFGGQLVDQLTVELREVLAEQARRTGLAALPGFRPEQVLTRLGSPPWEIVDLARQVKAQPRGVHRVRAPGRERQPGPEAHLDFLRRAPEPFHADGPAPLYQAHQCPQQEAGEPLRRAGDLLHALQLRAHPFHYPVLARDGRRSHSSPVVDRGDRQPSARRDAQEARTLQEARDLRRSRRRRGGRSDLLKPKYFGYRLFDGGLRIPV